MNTTATRTSSAFKDWFEAGRDRFGGGLWSAA